MRASGRTVRLRAMMPAAKSSSPLPLMATTWRFSWTARWVIRSAKAGPDLPGWRAARSGGGAGLRPGAALPLGPLGHHGQLVTSRDGGGHDPGRHRDPGQPDTANQDRAQSLQQGPDGQGAGAENIARATTASRSRPAATVGPIRSRARAPVTPPAAAKRPRDTQPHRTTQAPATQPRSAGGRAGAGPGRRPGTRKGLRGWPVGPDPTLAGGQSHKATPSGAVTT